LLELTNVDASALQFQIARVCELWWTNEWPNRELLLTQLLPYQLSTSLAKGAKEADVKRVFHMREALALLDFDDEDIVHLRELILRVVACPLYLKSTEVNILSYHSIRHV
jgi:condensin-2 complex subunit G2